jgi:hypothetical protein
VTGKGHATRLSAAVWRSHENSVCIRRRWVGRRCAQAGGDPSVAMWSERGGIGGHTGRFADSSCGPSAETTTGVPWPIAATNVASHGTFVTTTGGAPGSDRGKHRSSRGTRGSMDGDGQRTSTAARSLLRPAADAKKERETRDGRGTGTAVAPLRSRAGDKGACSCHRVDRRLPGSSR